MNVRPLLGNYPHSRIPAAFIFAAVIAFLGFRTAIVLLSSFFETYASIDMLFDDSYYYLAIAYNIAKHGMSSFDGITETNGYQPLWLLILTGFEVLFQFEKKALVSFTLALISAITLIPLFYCIKKRRDSLFFAIGAGLVSSYVCYPYIWLLGLETVLFAPLLVAVLFFIRKDGFIKSKNSVALVFCAVVLVRLDAVSLLMSYATLLFFAIQRQQGFISAIRKSIAFVFPASATLIIYVLTNKALYGNYVPVSGAAKMVGAQAFSNWGIAYHYLINAQYLVAPLIFLLIAEFVWGKFKQSAVFYYGMLILVLANVIQYLYYGAFSGWMPWPWYFYSYAMMLVLIVARTAFIAFSPIELDVSFTEKIGKGVTGTSILLFSFVAQFFLPGLFLYTMLIVQAAGTNPDESFNQRNVDQLASLFKTDQPLTVVMGDRSGGLGYWAPENVHVFQLEGLAANKEYLEARRNDSAEKWISENIKPEYLVVDRDMLPLIGPSGNKRYLVIEPIQGRVVFDHLMAFCFPEDALLKTNDDTKKFKKIIFSGGKRFVFNFKRAVPCDGELAAEVHEAIFASSSPRAKATAIEYGKSGLNQKWEQLDRAFALKLRDHWHKTL